MHAAVIVSNEMFCCFYRSREEHRQNNRYKLRVKNVKKTKNKKSVKMCRIMQISQLGKQVCIVHYNITFAECQVTVYGTVYHVLVIVKIIYFILQI